MYTGRVLEFLSGKGLTPGYRIRIIRRPFKGPYETGRGFDELEGILMEGNNSSSEGIITLKLKNGYNIGVDMNTVEDVELIERDSFNYRENKEYKPDSSLPRVGLIGTGGTIASFVDYRTGAVHPAVSPEDFLDNVPELSRICRIEPRILSSVLSEDIGPSNWMDMAREVVDAFSSGVSGILIAHGTDTMAYSSAALSFVLRDLPGPVIFVGAQRSSDRPSSDSSANLIDSALVALKGGFGEVVLVMHGSVSDAYSLIHRGTCVRKMHSSRRDAFRSVNTDPIGYVSGGEVRVIGELKGPNIGGTPRVEGGFEEKVMLLPAQSGLSREMIEYVGKNYRGLVLAGSGLGHVSSDLVGPIRDLVDGGIPVVMATGCINGRVNMNVYSNGRDLINAGVITAGSTLPETALVKTMWLINKVENELGRFDLDRFRECFLLEYAGEKTDITEGTSYGREYFDLLRIWGLER